jgi:arsenical pump membrane protein
MSSPPRRGRGRGGGTVDAMATAVAFVSLALLVGIAVGWPHRAAPAVAAVIAVVAAVIGGLVDLAGLEEVARTLWRPLVTITAVMAMTAAARALGILDRLAARIEPSTRGPVRRAFRVVFILSALAAALLSNDAAVLVLTPAILALLRTVYPPPPPALRGAVRLRGLLRPPGSRRWWSATR